MRVYTTSKGLQDLSLSPEQFKARCEEVMITFRHCNKAEFKVNEAV